MNCPTTIIRTCITCGESFVETMPLKHIIEAYKWTRPTCDQCGEFALKKIAEWLSNNPGEVQND